MHAVLSQFGVQLDVFGKSICETAARRCSDLIRLIRRAALIDRGDHAANGRRQLRVSAVDHAETRHVRGGGERAGGTEARPRPDAILQGQLVPAAARELGLAMLYGDRPAGGAALRGGAMRNHAQAFFLVTVGVDVHAAQLYVVTRSELLLIPAVFTQNGVTQYYVAATDTDVFDTGPEASGIPVIKIGEVYVFAFVVAPAEPDAGAAQYRYFFERCVSLHQIAIAALIPKDVVARARLIPTAHSIPLERSTVLQGRHTFGQLQFAVSLAFVAEPVFDICAGKFEASRPAALRLIDGGHAHIAVDGGGVGTFTVEQHSRCNGVAQIGHGLSPARHTIWNTLSLPVELAIIMMSVFFSKPTLILC